MYKDKKKYLELIEGILSNVEKLSGGDWLISVHDLNRDRYTLLQYSQCKRIEVLG